MTLTHIEDCYCPACGEDRLHRMEMTGQLKCMNDVCPNPYAAQRILSDREVHHIVRFDERGFFNIKHPLRERFDSELLDCPVHSVVSAAVHNVIDANGTYRLKYEPSWLDNPEFAGDPFSWERL